MSMRREQEDATERPSVCRHGKEGACPYCNEHR